MNQLLPRHLVESDIAGNKQPEDSRNLWKQVNALLSSHAETIAQLQQQIKALQKK